MKTFLFTSAMALAVSAQLFAGPMTAGDRQRLVAHLDMTEAWLDSEVYGLSDAQLKFKMAPTSWSIEEVVMHLAIAEPQYWDQFTQSLAKPVQPDFKPQATDAGMLWYAEIARATQLAEADNWLEAEIVRNVQQIESAMREDVYKPYSNNSFEGEAGEMLSFARERIAYVKCALTQGDRACGG